MIGKSSSSTALSASEQAAFARHAWWARTSLIVLCGYLLCLLALVLANDSLDARRAAVQWPPVLVTVLRVLVFPLWLVAAIRAVTLFVAWLAAEYRPPTLTLWSAAAAGGLVLLPLLALRLTAPVDPAARVSHCMANQLAIIHLIESQDDYDPELPLQWTEDVKQEARRLICPATQRRFHAPGGYGMNFFIVGQRVNAIRNPNAVMMTADSIRPGMLLYSAKDIDGTRHYQDGRRGFVCGFVDGHAEFRTDAAGLTWQ